MSLTHRAKKTRNQPTITKKSRNRLSIFFLLIRGNN